MRTRITSNTDTFHAVHLSRENLLLKKYDTTLINKLNSTFRSSSPGVLCKKVVLRNSAKFTGKHLCQSLFFNKAAGLCCIFCEISKNTFSYRTPTMAASVLNQVSSVFLGDVKTLTLNSS